MRKFAVIAFAFVLSATMMAGCRGGNSTDTTMPHDSTGHTGTSMPGDNARGRDNMIQDGDVGSRVERQRS